MKLWLSLFWLLFISQISDAYVENATPNKPGLIANGLTSAHFQKINFFNHQTKNHAHPTEKTSFEIKQWQGQLNFNLNASQGDFQLERVVVLLHLPKWSDQPIPLILSGGKIHWQRFPHQWQVTTSQLHIQLAHEQHLTNSVNKQLKYQADQLIRATLTGSLTLSPTGDLLSSQFSLRLPKTVELFHWRSFLPKKILMTLIPQLQTFQIAGFLRQGQIDFQHQGSTPPEFHITGQLNNVQLYWQQKSLLTAMVKNLAGYFKITSTQGVLALNQAEMTLSLPDFYSHAFELTRWQGRIDWQRQQQHWAISTQQLQFFEQATQLLIKGGLMIATPPRPEKFFWHRLTIVLQNGDLSQFYRWLPDKRWSKLTGWFETALSAGQLQQATVRLDGPLEALFEEGNLEISADLRHAQVNYAAGWPPIERARAQMLIKGRSLIVNGQRGELLKGQIQSMRLTIADILAPAPIIEFAGHLTGQASDGLRFIRESPLREQIDIAGFEVSGPFAVQVKLRIPLANNEESQVNGQITFKQAQISHHSLNLTITDVIGGLSFSDEQVVVKELLGKLDNQFVIISSLTLRNQHPKRTTLQVTGYSTAHFLFQQLVHFAPSLKPYAIPTYLSGKTQWLLTVNFPNEAIPDNRYLDIIFETDLHGMTVHLPAPLVKKRRERQLLTVKLKVFEEGFVETGPVENKLIQSPTNSNQSQQTEQIGVSQGEIYGRIFYGEGFNSTFKIKNQQFERGRVVLGNQPAMLPKQAMLHITGALAELSITDWLDALPSFSSDQKQDLSWPIIVDVQFEQLALWQQTFTAVALQARYFHRIWQAAITGKEIEGQIFFDQYQSPQRLELNFKQLKLTFPKSKIASQPTSAKTNLEPQKLPPIAFYCEVLQIDEMKWSRVTGESHPDRDGLIVKLTTQNQGLDLQARLQWRYVVQRHQTIIQIKADSKNIFLALQQLGYQQPPLVSKAGEISLHAYWPGTPDEFELKKMVAVLSLLIKDGQILEVEPGTLGRLFGLFDLYTLPKRLIFDFKDVFEKGFGFNTLAGVFFIQNGIAETEHLMIHGSAATVKISGQTDLEQKTFAQIATIYPHLSNPLPLAGVLTGGLGVGAAALIVQQVLRKLEKAIFFQYRITGRWEKPQVIRLPF